MRSLNVVKAGTLAVLATLWLYSSTSHSPQSVEYNLTYSSSVSTQYRLQLHWLAVEMEVDGAVEALRQLALSADADYWLDRLLASGDGESAWQRYQANPDAEGAVRWLSLAANSGIASAQFAYALLQVDPEAKQRWLQLAAEADLPDAIVALADWYLLQQQNDLALPWLAKAAEFDPRSQTTLARIVWDQGKHQRSKTLLTLAADDNYQPAVERLAMLKRIPPMDMQGKVDFVFTESDCHQRVGVVANGIEPMMSALKQVQTFRQDQRLRNLGICLSEPVWFTTPLSCDGNWNNERRLGCDISPLSEQLVQSSATHLIVIAQLGKANAQGGVMFLDAADEYSILVHELAHFAGFVDEYALNESSAKAYCGKIKATNLVFDGTIAYSSMARVGLWQSNPHFTGIYEANTCRQSPISAYKPADGITFMEHHDTNRIPPIYLALWSDTLRAMSGDRPLLRYLSTNSAVAPQTATGITTRLSKGTNEQTLTAMPNETFLMRSDFN